MPRQARLDAPGTLHHVMIRGIEGKSIFRDSRDRRDFVSRLGDLSKEMSTPILAWALLRNHVHILLLSGAPGLPLFMRRRIIKEMCKKEGVGEGELRMGGQARRVSRVRSKIAWSLSREYGFSLAEIARELGVCTSAIAKAVRKAEEKD